jgi:dihydropyrimidinase
MEFDLVVRNGTVITASERMECDVGIAEGKIAALMRGLPAGKREVDASGRLVLPGGIEAHCHIEQQSSLGIMTSDDFESASISAVFGGNTTIVPFAAQHKGQSLVDVVEDYEARAAAKSVIDYAYHLIVSDVTDKVLHHELPALIRQGLTSFKVYTTYELLKLDDYQILDVLAVARREGAMVMVHAENHDMIRWLTKRLLDAGHREPKFHGIAHTQLGEAEATSRAISLAELIDQPLLVVHVSSREATAAIRDAQSRGLKIYGETCPQYLFLTIDDLDRQGMEGAMFCCSPPPRDAASQEAIWTGIENGTFQVFSSDHAPYRFDETAKLAAGPDASFNKIANGIPGIELRMPLLFSEGVRSGKINIHRFVELTATNAARLYGLFPRKGSIAIGADADLAIWDPDLAYTVTWNDLHDQVGYTPYANMNLTGWPTTVVSRGRVIVDQKTLFAAPGSGEFIPREPSELARPSNKLRSEINPARNFGAKIF